MAARLDISQVSVFGSDRGISLLSTEYTNAHTKLLWACERGHEWLATPNSIKRGSGCAQCAGNAKHSADEMRAIAAERGGSFASSQYEGARTRHSWICADGHQFFASPDNVINKGSWCPNCAGVARLSLSEMAADAERNGGILLSKIAGKAGEKHRYRCGLGHEFDMKPSVVRFGSWCPHCSGNAPLSISEMHEIAASRGGRCLSESCKGAFQKLLWQCADGHTFEATPSNVKHNGRWCPECAGSRGEAICRATLEVLLGAPMPRVRPAWLRYTSGHALELDGYNEGLAIAFEYQGSQHFEVAEHWGCDESDLIRQRDRDEFKARVCRERAIKLIVIDQFPSLADLRACEALVIRAASDAGVGHQLTQRVTLPAVGANLQF